MLHTWVSDLLPCNFSNFMNLRIRNTLGQKFKSILLFTDHFFSCHSRFTKLRRAVHILMYTLCCTRGTNTRLSMILQKHDYIVISHIEMGIFFAAVIVVLYVVIISIAIKFFAKSSGADEERDGMCSSDSEW